MRLCALSVQEEPSYAEFSSRTRQPPGDGPIVVASIALPDVVPATATARTLMLRLVSMLAVGVVGTASWIALSRRQTATQGLGPGGANERSE